MDLFNPKSDRTIDPFIQKAISHWLDTTGEKGYQMSFAQYLASIGCNVVYYSKHTAHELGKDIIAIDKEGEIHVFQLKGKDINLRQFNDIKGELEMMVDAAIEHPAIKKGAVYKSYLVSNGNLMDPAQQLLVNLNSNKWSHNPVVFINKGTLLNCFLELASGVFPGEMAEYKEYVEILLSDGTGLPDLQKIDSFLDSIFLNETKSKEEIKRRISSVVFYIATILEPYKKQENHIAVMQIITISLSKILYASEVNNLSNEYWKASWDILFSELESFGEALNQEITSLGFRTTNSLFDQLLLPYRKHLGFSFVLAHKLSLLIREPNKDINKIVSKEEFISYTKEPLILNWGEAAMISNLFAYFLFRKVKAINIHLELEKCINEITMFNGRFYEKLESTLIFPSPYYDIEKYVSIILGLEDFNDKFSGGSYLLKSIINTLATDNHRDVLERTWKEISFMSFIEFKPAKVSDYLLMRNRTGENLSISAQKNQSFTGLIKEVETLNEKSLPKSLIELPEFIPYFLMVLPQRANPTIINFIDKILKK